MAKNDIENEETIEDAIWSSPKVNTNMEQFTYKDPAKIKIDNEPEENDKPSNKSLEKEEKPDIETLEEPVEKLEQIEKVKQEVLEMLKPQEEILIEEDLEKKMVVEQPIEPKKKEKLEFIDNEQENNEERNPKWLIWLFLFLIILVLFMPNIVDFLKGFTNNKYWKNPTYGSMATNPPTISDKNYICNKKDETTYYYKMTVANDQLKKMYVRVLLETDIEEKLVENNNICLKIKEDYVKTKGVNATCQKSVKASQTTLEYDLSKNNINLSNNLLKLDYKYNDSYANIKTIMEKDGFTCNQE